MGGAGAAVPLGLRGVPTGGQRNRGTQVALPEPKPTLTQVALHEALRCAHQQSDDQCLAYSLLWLAQARSRSSRCSSVVAVAQQCAAADRRSSSSGGGGGGRSRVVVAAAAGGSAACTEGRAHGWCSP